MAAGTGQGMGIGKGQGKGQEKGLGQGLGEGQGKGLGQREGQGKRKGQGEGQEKGLGLGKGLGQGQGVGMGEGKRQEKGKGQGEGEGQGKELGQGKGERKEQGQGMRQGLGQGQGKGKGEAKGQGQEQGKGQGEGQVQGQGVQHCPHCHRPFKRLRSHLPHCKAAPTPGPGSGMGSGSVPAPKPPPGSAPGSGSKRSPRPAPAVAPGSGPSPGPLAAPGTEPGPARPGGSSERQPREVTGGTAGSGRDVEPAVQDVATALDLRPEEVEDVPKRMERGVKVVIEKHRARVVREKEPRSRAGPAQGTDPGRAARPQHGETAPGSTHAEPRSPGAVRNVPGSSKGGKIGLKATKVLPEPTEGRSNPGDLIQQEGRDKSVAGEERVPREVGGGCEAPVSALHPKNLHLSVTEALGGHGQGTSKNELSGLERLGASREQMARVSEPLLGTGRDPGLAPHQAWLCSPKSQPSCSAQASSRSPRGLEWFAGLDPECEGLRMLQGKRFQEDGITVKSPGGSFSEGQRGPLSERPLMEVRLGELHTWISTCDFSPQGLLGTVQKAWNSYYAKYINVRKGGPAGISMLLTGYCLLSYSWNYEHLKRYRWRKYH